MDAIRNVRNSKRIGSPSTDNSATTQKKEALCNFCKHRSWILANTSEIQHNAGTVERTETHTQKKKYALTWSKREQKTFKNWSYLDTIAKVDIPKHMIPKRIGGATATRSSQRKVW
jgi:hypothetical protein